MLTRYDFHGLTFEVSNEMSMESKIEGDRIMTKVSMPTPRLVSVNLERFGREVSMIDSPYGPILVMSRNS